MSKGKCQWMAQLEANLLVGLPDMVDEGAFKMLEDAAKGLGLC